MSLFDEQPFAPVPEETEPDLPARTDGERAAAMAAFVADLSAIGA